MVQHGCQHKGMKVAFTQSHAQAHFDGVQHERNAFCSQISKVKIDIAIADGMVDQTIEAISKAAQTGKIGDGKIFVSSVEQAIRIRTGETGSEAL